VYCIGIICNIAAVIVAAAYDQIRDGGVGVGQGGDRGDKTDFIINFTFKPPEQSLTQPPRTRPTA